MQEFNPKETVLNKIESLVAAWNKGEVNQSQSDYKYLQGFCESLNVDFSTTLTHGLSILMKRCVGVKDTMQYVNYINGVIPNKE